jgi:hypothetical protein
MHLRLLDPAALHELRQHFVRSGFSVEGDSESLVIGRPGATNAADEQREIELHLQVWQTMHPGVPIEPTSQSS